MEAWKSNFKDYYKILQVNSNAEQEVIQAAYKALIKKYHPDVSNASHNLAQEINEAYEVLSNEKYRQLYLKKYQSYLRQNRPLFLTEEKGPAYVSQRADLGKREELLRLREEELKQKELQIKLKMKLMQEIHKYSENSEKNSSEIEIDYSELVQNFVDGKENDFQNACHFLERLESKRKVSLIKKILKQKLSLARESILYELLLNDASDDACALLDGAFKFKKHYPALFSLIAHKELKQYGSKVKAVVENMVFSLGDNVTLMPLALDIYSRFFPVEELLSLLFRVKEVVTKKKVQSSLLEPLLLKFLILVQKNEDLEVVFRDFIRDFKNYTTSQAVSALADSVIMN